MADICGYGSDPEKFVKDVAKAMVSFFSEDELQLLSDTDVNGSPWIFEEQIIDFYCSQYPSLATYEDIDLFIYDRVEEYRPILNGENVDEVREMFLEEFMGGVFSSPEVNVWNDEMVKNFETFSESNISADVVWAVDFAVSFISSYCREIPNFIFVGREWSLRECLLSRWYLSLLGCSRQEFEGRLKFLYLLTDKSPSEWNPEEPFSTVKLYAFISEIDVLFLFPNRKRDMNRRLGVLDTGRNIGFMNTLRFMKSFKFSLSYLMEMVAAFIILCIWVGWYIWALT